MGAGVAARAELTCSLCGHRFDPAANPACGRCPLSSGCLVCCCPACGFSMADPSRSRLARAYRRLSRS